MSKTFVPAAPQGGMRKQIEKAVAQIVADAAHRGFYGSATLVLSIQDGSIQTVRVAVERLIK